VWVKDARKSESLVVMTGIEVEFFFWCKAERNDITSSESCADFSVSLDTDDAGVQLRENCSRFLTWKSRRYD